jgi:hypothetical protein
LLYGREQQPCHEEDGEAGERSGAAAASSDKAKMRMAKRDRERAFAVEGVIGFVRGWNEALVTQFVFDASPINTFCVNSSCLCPVILRKGGDCANQRNG